MEKKAGSRFLSGEETRGKFGSGEERDIFSNGEESKMEIEVEKKGRGRFRSGEESKRDIW